MPPDMLQCTWGGQTMHALEMLQVIAGSVEDILLQSLLYWQ